MNLVASSKIAIQNGFPTDKLKFNLNLNIENHSTNENTTIAMQKQSFFLFAMKTIQLKPIHFLEKKITQKVRKTSDESHKIKLIIVENATMARTSTLLS